MKLGPFVIKHTIGQTVQDCNQKCSVVARLINLRIIQVTSNSFNSFQSSESLLVFSAGFADVRQNVEGELTQVEGAWLVTVAYDV